MWFDQLLHAARVFDYFVVIGIAFMDNQAQITETIMYRSNRSFNMLPPPGISRAFETFAVPGRGEFDHQSLPGGGEFDPHALGVGNLNSTLDFM